MLFHPSVWPQQNRYYRILPSKYSYGVADRVWLLDRGEMTKERMSSIGPVGENFEHFLLAIRVDCRTMGSRGIYWGCDNHPLTGFLVALCIFKEQGFASPGCATFYTLYNRASSTVQYSTVYSAAYPADLKGLPYKNNHQHHKLCSIVVWVNICQCVENVHAFVCVWRREWGGGELSNLVFSFISFLLSLNPRPFVQSFFVLRYACAPTATRI